MWERKLDFDLGDLVQLSGVQDLKPDLSLNSDPAMY